MGYTEHTSFAGIKQWLSGLDDQTVGVPAAVCETGELYIEFFQAALARPEDVAVIEAHVAGQFAAQLTKYLAARSGRIYWRIPFESDVSDATAVVRYDVNGPDEDVLTGRKCILDKNWKRVACYCRLYRATMQAPDISVARVRAA